MPAPVPKSSFWLRVVGEAIQMEVPQRVEVERAMQEISHRQVQRLIFGAHACLVEVMSEQNFREAHLPGAINVPLNDEFEAHIQDAVPDKNAPVIVYCSDSDCRLSPAAARRLEALGYTKVFDYSGGKSDWERSGLQIEKGPAEGQTSQ